MMLLQKFIIATYGLLPSVKPPHTATIRDKAPSVEGLKTVEPIIGGTPMFLSRRPQFKHHPSWPPLHNPRQRPALLADARKPIPPMVVNMPKLWVEFLGLATLGAPPLNPNQPRFSM